MINRIFLRRLGLAPLQSSWLLSVLICLVLSLAGLNAQAEEAELADEELACLKCHDKDDIFKKTEQGEKVSLKISTKAFAASMHNETSCTDCHEDLDEDTHGKVKVPMESKRAYALSMKDSCKSCHKKTVGQYEDGVHAAMVKDGNDKAPICSDCHNPHTLISTKEVTPIANTPCAQCHKDIFQAYSKDVHGLERVAKGKSAPLCADCHSSHAVKAASFGDSIKDSCLNCHKDAAASHDQWLPNAGRHFQAISCPVCHVPNADRRVNLRLVDKSDRTQISEKRGVPQFERLTKAADSSGQGLDESELRSFLKQFNLENVEGKAILSGRLEVRSGVQAHQISEKEQAIKDCKVCHQAGATPFQSVVLTMAGPDGRTLRYGVEKEVLGSITAIDTVRGFYAIGSTRIKLLDYLLVLVLLGVACVPIAHLTAHRLFKKKRDALKAAREAASRQK